MYYSLWVDSGKSNVNWCITGLKRVKKMKLKMSFKVVSLLACSTVLAKSWRPPRAAAHCHFGTVIFSVKPDFSCFRVWESHIFEYFTSSYFVLVTVKKKVDLSFSTQPIITYHPNIIQLNHDVQLAEEQTRRYYADSGMPHASCLMCKISTPVPPPKRLLHKSLVQLYIISCNSRQY
jgi:hypothetical protein